MRVVCGSCGRLCRSGIAVIYKDRGGFCIECARVLGYEGLIK